MTILAETDEQIKKRKKGIGSKNHSAIQFSLIVAFAMTYGKSWKAIPELSLEIDGAEKIPDISLYQEIDITPARDVIKMQEMPLGVIEILSPTQPIADLVQKAEQYFSAGIQSYWLVIPSTQSIYVYKNTLEYNVFSHKETLIDNQLSIELDLTQVFH